MDLQEKISERAEQSEFTDSDRAGYDEFKYPLRIVLSIFLLATACILTACSFSIPIILTNSSDGPITVRYTLKNRFAGRIVPELVTHRGVSGNTPFPGDRLYVDFEQWIVEAKLMPGETMLIDSPSDRIIENPDELFNLATLRITSETNTLELEGKQVFDKFRPVERNHVFFGPKYIRYELDWAENCCSDDDAD